MGRNFTPQEQKVVNKLVQEYINGGGVKEITPEGALLADICEVQGHNEQGFMYTYKAIEILKKFDEVLLSINDNAFRMYATKKVIDEALHQLAEAIEENKSIQEIVKLDMQVAEILEEENARSQ